MSTNARLLRECVELCLAVVKVRADDWDTIDKKRVDYYLHVLESLGRAFGPENMKQALE